MKTTDRHALIIKIIKSKSVETQEQLKSELEAYGIETTQATVSRDIKKLKLVKTINSKGRYCYSVHSNDELPENEGGFFKSAIISIDYALNNVVIKLKEGMAQAACARIDQKHINGIIGTIAGDDTILLITKSEQDSASVVKEINEFFK